MSMYVHNGSKLLSRRVFSSFNYFLWYVTWNWLLNFILLHHVLFSCLSIFFSIFNRNVTTRANERNNWSVNNVDYDWVWVICLKIFFKKVFLAFPTISNIEPKIHEVEQACACRKTLWVMLNDFLNDYLNAFEFNIFIKLFELYVKR